MIFKSSFVGAKVALLADCAVLAYPRDDFDGLPWRNQCDLPGGGRKGCDPVRQRRAILAEDAGGGVSGPRACRTVSAGPAADRAVGFGIGRPNSSAGSGRHPRRPVVPQSDRFSPAFRPATVPGQCARIAADCDAFSQQSLRKLAGVATNSGFFARFGNDGQFAGAISTYCVSSGGYTIWCSNFFLFAVTG